MIPIRLSAFLIFLVIIANSTMATDSKEIKPTVFIASRSTVAEIDWYAIIDAAWVNWSVFSVEERLAHPYFQNIVIIDEGKLWAVCFFTVGNGRMVTETTKGFFDVEDYAIVGNPNNIVYLDKETLKVVEPPEGAIGHLPYSTTGMLPRESKFFDDRPRDKRSR